MSVIGHFLISIKSFNIFNPSPEAIEFIAENQLKGQYGRVPGENPEARPLDRNNAMMESSGSFLQKQHLDKTFAQIGQVLVKFSGLGPGSAPV